MPTRSPDALVSVIIPTFNRCASLRDTLLTLGRQTFPTDRFEVVVVDDGSADETAPVASADYSCAIRYVRQTNQGCAAARNHGAVESVGQILVFIDDDMSLDPDYLRQLVAEHEQFPRIVAMGALYPFLGEATTPFESWVRRETRQYTEAEWVGYSECTSNNVSVARDDFTRIGQWRSVAGDGQALWGDVEFGYRAERAGLRFRRSARAICYHRDYAIRDLKTYARRMQHSARLAHALFEHYPEVEAALPMFRDMSAPNPRADSLTLARRKRVRALSATTLGVRSQEAAIALAERCFPSPTVLGPLYRWIVGAYIYRGYRDGARTRSGASAGGRPAQRPQGAGHA